MSTNTESKELTPLSKEVAKLMGEEVAKLRSELAEAVQQRQNYSEANGYLRMKIQVWKSQAERLANAARIGIGQKEGMLYEVKDCISAYEQFLKDLT